MSSSRLLAVVVVLALPLLSACGGSDEEGSRTSSKDAAGVAATYADLVLASYDASIASTRTMQKAIDAFIANPSKATLSPARRAWLTARDDYTPTEAFRFYGGPIDDPEDGPEGKINAWPMDEAYVDYVKGNAKAGIVNDTKGYPSITTDVIVEANERGGETNISSAGTRSSSCSGVRISPRTVQARARSATTRANRTPNAAAPTCSSRPASCCRPEERARSLGRAGRRVSHRVSG